MSDGAGLGTAAATSLGPWSGGGVSQPRDGQDSAPNPLRAGDRVVVVSYPAKAAGLVGKQGVVRRVQKGIYGPTYFYVQLDDEDCTRAFIEDEIERPFEPLVDWELALLDASIEPEYVLTDKAHEALDMVNKPPHYTDHPSGVEPIEITQHLSFCLGNVVKYVMRHRMKGDPVGDLQKARWYLDKELERISRGD